MREILFRGKRLDNGKWEYGDLMRDNVGGSYVFPNEAENLYLEYEVDPATVGQYSGFTDKNGKKIFEGDYLKTTALTGEVYVQEVRWTNEFNIAGFRMFDDEWDSWDDFDDYDGRIEVVGNIHDDDVRKIREEVYNA